jgi:hypothetical protein
MPIKGPLLSHTAHRMLTAVADRNVFTAGCVEVSFVVFAGD